jgi:hypothetical protein
MSTSVGKFIEFVLPLQRIESSMDLQGTADVSHRS